MTAQICYKMKNTAYLYTVKETKNLNLSVTHA